MNHRNFKSKVRDTKRFQIDIKDICHLLDNVEVEIWSSPTDQHTVLSIYPSDDFSKILIDIEKKVKK